MTSRQSTSAQERRKKGERGRKEQSISPYYYEQTLGAARKERAKVSTVQWAGVPGASERLVRQGRAMLASCPPDAAEPNADLSTSATAKGRRWGTSSAGTCRAATSESLRRHRPACTSSADHFWLLRHPQSKVHGGASVLAHIIIEKNCQS